MIPGWGYRTAADVLMEMSFHLSQPAVYTQLSAGVGTGLLIASVATTAAMYSGAQLVAEKPGAAGVEIITVDEVIDATHFSATFANGHSTGAPVWGATFPVQQATDPIFTQAEMLNYLSRAQNEFLVAVPSFYQRFTQTVATSQVYQTTPATAVLIDRIAASPVNIPISSLVRSNNVVTLTTSDPHGLAQYNTLAVVNPADASFAGAFAVASAPSATTLTYLQIGSDGSTTGGTIQQMSRLYELTQQELTMQNRGWQSTLTGPLTNWFEDRAGLYKWGVGGIPNSNYPVELLCAVRDADALTMLDGFMVPDVCIHALKYLALSYSWSKDGVAQQPAMADFCMKRYAQIVMAAQRYIASMRMGVSQ